jgi:hypothetical protein
MRIQRLHLAWNDAAALDRHAVHLACTGTTAELRAYLDMCRRRYPIRAVRLERGANWRMNPDSASIAELQRLTDASATKPKR